MPDRFPVLVSGLGALALGCPRSVPWAVVAPHAIAAQVNFDASLRDLATRGGLDPAELWAVCHDVSYREAPPAAACVAWLAEVA